MPKVSIIIPAYNAENTIAETINSVLQQTFVDFELIIVNDGSTDDTEKVIQTINDSRIKYFYQKNIGQCAASNLGIAKSTGDFIKFLDADDIINNIHIEMQYEKIKHDSSSIASCKWGRFYNNNFKSAKFVPEQVWNDLSGYDWIKISLSQRYSMMGGWLWLIPKELLNKVGWWDEKLTLNNDFEFSIRLLLGAKNVVFADESILYYRTGISTSVSNYSTEKVYNEVYNANLLGCNHLLAFDNSSLMKTLCANRLQECVFSIYPKYKNIVEKYEAHIKAWGGSTIKLEGGFALKLLSNIFGWKNAKEIKLILNKIF